MTPCDQCGLLTEDKNLLARFDENGWPVEICGRCEKLAQTLGHQD